MTTCPSSFSSSFYTNPCHYLLSFHGIICTVPPSVLPFFTNDFPSSLLSPFPLLLMNGPFYLLAFLHRLSLNLIYIVHSVVHFECHRSVVQSGAPVPATIFCFETKTLNQLEFHVQYSPCAWFSNMEYTSPPQFIFSDCIPADLSTTHEIN